MFCGNGIVALNGREVIIAYDGDVARKKQVRQAMGELAAYLQTKGARVSTVWLPDTDDKTGLDDYLVAGHTVDELRQLVRPFDSHLDGAPGEAKESVATQLIELARDAFTLGVTETEDAFGVETGSHIAMMLRNGKTGLRAELARRYFAQSNTAAPQQALSDACLALEGFAAQENPSKVHLRVAEELRRGVRRHGRQGRACHLYPERHLDHGDHGSGAVPADQAHCLDADPRGRR
jgi:hypothetical protein